MKKLKAFKESNGASEARKKAEAQGLEYRGFGFWADPNTGEVVARSSGDDLKPVDHDPLKGKAGEGEEGGKKGASSFGDVAAMAAQEVQKGEVKPDEEKAKKDVEWESGPDGSTDVGTGKNDVEKDVFVDKDEDEDTWVSGADGSNHTNFSFDTFKEAALSEDFGTDMENVLFGGGTEPKKKSAAEIAKEKGWRSDGHGIWFDTMDTPVAKTVAGELVMLTSAEQEREQAKIVARNARKPEGAELTGNQSARDGADYLRNHQRHAKRGMKMTDMLHGYLKDQGLDPAKEDPKLAPLAGKRAIPAQAPKEEEEEDDMLMGQPDREQMVDRLKASGDDDRETFKMAKDALADLSPEARKQVLDKIAKTQPDSMRAQQGKYTKAVKAYNQVVRVPALGKDAEAVQELNDQVQEFISDPNYELGPANRGQELGEGAFGTVYLSKDGQNVIKDGEIGQEEMKALDLLKDLPEFPTLINANFTDTFKHKSSAYNNPDQRTSQKRGAFDSKYWNPEEESDFDRKFPSARGTYAMSLAAGSDINDVMYEYECDQGEDSEECYEIESNFWSTLAKMHKAGVSHNDLHGGNIYVDDDRKANFLDLGLAKVDRLSALMEGLSSLNGNNYQLTMRMEWGNLNNIELKQQLEFNRQKLLATIEEDYADWDDEEDTAMLEEMLEGGIRLGPDYLKKVYDGLQMDQQQLQEYIDILYEGIVQEEPDNSLEGRMAKGYSDMVKSFAKDQGMGYEGKGALDLINNVNQLRKQDGKKPLSVKGIDMDDYDPNDPKLK